MRLPPALLVVPQALSVTKDDQPADLRKQHREDREAFDGQIVARYQSGEGIKTLAAELGMHHRTVKKRLLAAGVELRNHRKLTDDEIHRARELYEQGLSMQRIGAEVGVSHTTIRRHLHRLGVQMRPMGRPTAT